MTDNNNGAEAPPETLPAAESHVAPPLGWRVGQMRDAEGLPVVLTLEVLTAYGAFGFMFDRADATDLIGSLTRERDRLPALQVAREIPAELRHPSRGNL